MSWLELEDTDRKRRRENPCPCCLADRCPCDIVHIDVTNTPFDWCDTHSRECDGLPPKCSEDTAEAWPEVLRWF